MRRPNEMRLDAETVTALGGILAGATAVLALAGRWAMCAWGAVRRRWEWKWRIETGLERNTEEIAALRDEMRRGFARLERGNLRAGADQ